MYAFSQDLTIRMINSAYTTSGYRTRIEIRPAAELLILSGRTGKHSESAI